MTVELASSGIEIFSVSPRSQNPADYWLNIENVIRWSEEHAFTGILIFTGNDTLVEPWMAAQATFTLTQRLCPLVAVNPVYMHPFTAARMVATFSYLYKRRTHLNMVTGAAVNYLEALNDTLDHDERYDRLTEYARLVAQLASSPMPLSFEGQFYKTKNLQLLPRVPPDQQPRFLFAGHSEAATKAAAAVDGQQMQMLSGTLDNTGTGRGAIHFGIVTRPNRSDAWSAARKIFPEDAIGRKELELSMANTDSVWKQRLKRAADMESDAARGYWLDPFRMFKADCPYFVGSYGDISDLFATLAAQGITTFVLDLPAVQEEFHHVDAALGLRAVADR